MLGNENDKAGSPRRERAILAMATPATLPELKRKRGNPHWGRPMPLTPALATEFEQLVRQLQLTPETYTFSRELRVWCDRNRNRVYIPEWLLKEWGMTVDVTFGNAA